MLACTAAVTFGCAGVNVTDVYDDEQAEFSALNENLIIKSQDLRIPARNATNLDYEVCWVMTQQEFDDYEEKRGWVREAIVNSWEDVTWIDFTGWGDRCSDSSTKRRLYFDPDMADNGGAPGSTANGAIRIDPDFAYPGWTPRQSLEYIAVHEFGHGIALNHPQKRHDWVNCAGNNDVDQDPNPGLAVIGDVDEESVSVMSYCLSEQRQHYLDTGSWLSDADIRNVRALYGGSGQHINYGSPTLLRNQNKKYLKIADSTPSLTSTFGAQDVEPNQVVSFEPTGSTPSNKVTVQYGDTVRILYEPTQLYLCSVEQGNTVVLVGLSPATPAQTLNNNCSWTIQRTSSAVGGSNIDVNDPFRVRREPAPSTGHYYLQLESESHWRALGPIEPF